ncbi:hypothetical protein MRX96_006049 [Rhipicephalus microplus]
MTMSQVMLFSKTRQFMSRNIHRVAQMSLNTRCSSGLYCMSVPSFTAIKHYNLRSTPSMCGSVLWQHSTLCQERQQERATKFSETSKLSEEIRAKCQARTICMLTAKRNH